MNCLNTDLRTWRSSSALNRYSREELLFPQSAGAEGVAFLISPFPDESEVIIERTKGIIHYNTVLFALKKNFEAEIFMRGHEIRINLIDVGTNDIFKLLARSVAKHAKLPSNDATSYTARATGPAGLQ